MWEEVEKEVVREVKDEWVEEEESIESRKIVVQKVLELEDKEEEHKEVESEVVEEEREECEEEVGVRRMSATCLYLRTQARTGVGNGDGEGKECEGVRVGERECVRVGGR